MRRLVALASALALGVVLAGCSAEAESPAEPAEPTVANTLAGPEPEAPYVGTSESPAPEEPDVSTSESPAPVDESDFPATEAQAATLEETFVAMLEAVAADGADGLAPYLASSARSDITGIADWEWTAGDCFEGAVGESGCVGYFEKDGSEIETVFLFDQIDGRWLLTESYVW